MPAMRITHLGTATTLLELEGLRFLTDPTFDEPGKTYGFGFGTRSKKVDAVRMPAGGLGQLDAVLLSHDHHADNLDDAGRALLPGAGKVLTTVSGARRLGGNALGLQPWQSTTVGPVKVTATPARHGPPLSGPIVGDVVGFVLEWPGQKNGALYISGDTVRFAGVDEVAKRFRIGTAILHIGGVAFPISGPLRYTFNGQEAADVAELLGARTVVPIHYEGWTHFREKRDQTQQALSRLGDRVRWLVPGEPVELDV
jgi:L-ascorbate metabolism protein UlaG (beta-lactamase superfamily)